MTLAGWMDVENQILAEAEVEVELENQNPNHDVPKLVAFLTAIIRILVEIAQNVPCIRSSGGIGVRGVTIDELV